MKIPRSLWFLLSLALCFPLNGCHPGLLVRDREARHYTPVELSVFAGLERPQEWQEQSDTDLRQSIQQTLRGDRAAWLRSQYPQLVALEQAFSAISDHFQIPVQGRLSSPFGYRMHPVYHRLLLHTGLDISALEELPIQAVAPGVVTFADVAGGDGLEVIIDHGGGLSTVYAHACQLMVRVGSKVRSGQVIALVGHTGLATGSHLHLEVRLRNRPKDPLFFIPGLRRLGWESQAAR